MMLSGVMSLISTILSFAMLFVLLSLKKCYSALVLLLKKFLPDVILNTNTASMFMPNRTVVTLRLLPNISVAMILSILVDTFISKISLTMQPGPKIDSISGA